MSAEAIVSFVVGKLGDLLIEEALLLHGVRDEIEWVVRELGRMQHFLKDADAKQKGDESVRGWIAEIRDIAYDAEDVIDTFILSQSAGGKRRGHVDRFIWPVLKELPTRRKVAKEIQRIKVRIDDISRSLSTYGIRDINDDGSQQTRLNERRQFLALFEEPDVVGMQESMSILREQLIGEEVRRCVITVVGMGGSGKTTLAKTVYRDVKEEFDCHAFIYLSQQYRIKDILIRIMDCIMILSREEMERSNDQGLGKRLRDHLSDKRYLIVIDDIWTMEAWDTLKLVLPDSLNKSRVMLTTRIKEVALHADPLSRPHDIRLLNDDESWELFLRRIFPVGRNTSAVCPSELEVIGRKILAKCHGLPLAIVVLGGLLSRRDKTFSAWSKVFESITWHFTEGSNQCMEILALSYFDLPHYLKPCFLYLGLFPEDFEIRSRELVRLWIAEGFIHQRGNEIMEDVAEDYLEELIGRSMIQVATKRSNGSVSTCSIHDLLRDLSIAEATQINFFAAGSGNKTSSSSTSVRRLALYHNVSQDDTVNHSTATLRSMLYFSESAIHLTKLLKRGGKLLRVLHVNDASLPGDTLPKEIGEEAHLRYLSLRYTGISRLPSSIGNLSNLQTLTIIFSTGTLPSAIGNLERLRHLYAYDWDIDGHPKFNNSKNLQTLCITAGSWIKDGLDKLSNLRKLGISAVLNTQHNALSHAIEKLSNLRSCKLIDSSSIPPFVSFAHHPNLYKLFLEGQIETLPGFPQNLAKLTLCGSQLQQDAIEELEKLPNLRVLRLREKSYCSERMICSSGAFPRLEFLQLNCTYLKEWIAEEGALTSLKRVQLDNRNHLTTLPKQVHDLLK